MLCIHLVRHLGICPFLPHVWCAYQCVCIATHMHCILHFDFPLCLTNFNIGLTKWVSISNLYYLWHLGLKGLYTINTLYSDWLVDFLFLLLCNCHRKVLLDTVVRYSFYYFTVCICNLIFTLKNMDEIWAQWLSL